MSFYRAAFTEFLVTALYVFFGVGSMLHWPANTPSILQIAITFNLAAATTVQIAWHASGAHVNPAVTVAFLFGSRISLAKAACYVVAQLAGGIAGAAVLYAVTPGNIRGSLGINTVRLQPLTSESMLLLRKTQWGCQSRTMRQKSGGPHSWAQPFPPLPRPSVVYKPMA